MKQVNAEEPSLKGKAHLGTNNHVNLER